MQQAHLSNVESQKLEQTLVVLIETIIELFYSLYRKDHDLAILEKSISDAFTSSIYEIIKASTLSLVETFRAQKGTTKEQDELFVKESSEKLARSIIATHTNEIFEAIFE